MTDQGAGDRPEQQNLPAVSVGGPYLKMAVLCEKILREADGVVSIIRVVDRITLSVAGPGAPTDMPAAPITLTLVLGFVSGFARGAYRVKVKLMSPSHQEVSTFELPMLLEGDDRGAQMALQLGFQANEEGLYWFEVYLFEEGLVTKVPLRVVYQRLSVSRSATTP